MQFEFLQNICTEFCNYVEELDVNFLKKTIKEIETHHKQKVTVTSYEITKSFCVLKYDCGKESYLLLINSYIIERSEDTPEEVNYFLAIDSFLINVIYDTVIKHLAVYEC